MSFRARRVTPPLAADDVGNILEHWAPSGSPYLTNGINLYRYVGGVPSGTSELVALEECRSLKIQLFSLAELRALCLRAVAPASSDSGSRVPD